MLKFKLFGIIWNFDWLPFMLYISWGLFSVVGLFVVVNMSIWAMIGYGLSTTVFLSLAPAMDAHLTKITTTKKDES